MVVPADVAPVLVKVNVREGVDANIRVGSNAKVCGLI
jgi:hypothetical protein